MKQILRILFVVFLVNTSQLNAQCIAGYTQATLNWDQLDYYYNSGSNVQPYGYSGGNYISNAMEQTQKFAIGKNNITFATSNTGMVLGENSNHDGDIAGYTGDDVQFTSSSNGQTITMTFNSDVLNTLFTLYDIDGSQRIDVDAYNAANVKQSVTITVQGSTILTPTNGTNALVTATSTTFSSPDNRGTATISIPTQINRVVITFTTIGSDATIWLSDIYACVNGSFPNNYQQTGNNQPLQGPFVNQPDYFLVTPDNNSVYMVDPATGNATLVFTDASKTYVNSFAYDPYRRYLYYISENSTVNGSNRELKRYDFNTATITTLVADITATLGIPTMGSGVESAGACFYDDAIYLGIEGGRFSSGSGTRPRETIIWRIDLDASFNPTTAYQVFATEAYQYGTNTSLHDFGDFIIRDGILYDFNTARNSSSYVQSKYHHFNLTSGSHQAYNNPTSSIWNGQAAMTWDGTLYYFKNGSSGTGYVGIYNEDGTNGTDVGITVIDGTGAWPGGNGDASENFRPAVDFGDAPSSYDPNAASPAAHAVGTLVKLGSNYDLEYVSRGQAVLANSDNHDDAIPSAEIFNPDYNSYLLEATVFNNSGSDATVCAWLDYDGDGQYESSEGISVTVGSSASPQSVWLYWPLIYSSLAQGTYTYLRIRVTSTSNGMTTDHPTGYFPDGEVEDFRVPVNSYPLSTQAFDFDAKLTPVKSVKLNWRLMDESQIAYYVIERNTDINRNNWELVHAEASTNTNGMVNYEATDLNTLSGTSFYRLKTIGRDGKMKISQVKKIENRASQLSVSIAPNPAKSHTVIYIHSNAVSNQEATVEILNTTGALVHKEKIKLVNGNNSVEVRTNSKMPGGYYIVRISCENKILTKSLIISK